MSEENRMDEFEKAQHIFIEEARDLISELENSLIELESESHNKELIDRIFRALHTIKGTSSMFGYNAITSLTHEAETMYDMVRNGNLRVTSGLINLTLMVIDGIKMLLESNEKNVEIEKTTLDKILLSIKVFISQNALQQVIDTEKKNFTLKTSHHYEESSESKEKEITYRIRFKPNRDIFYKGINPLSLLKEVREMGKCIVIAHTDSIPEIDTIDPEACYTYWDIILTTTKEINAIKDVFIFVEGDCELTIDIISEDYEHDEVAYKRLGEILIDRGDITAEDLEKVIGKRKRIGEMLIEEGIVESTKVASAIAEQLEAKEVLQRKQKMELLSSIRIPSERLDRFVNLVGELVTVQARLSQASAMRNDPELLIIAEEIARLTEELRDSTMSIRLLPISTIFSKFRRLVRDLSRELGKEVKLLTEGGETELDKTIIERLNDPLVHLIRNCIDHGIEPPKLRKHLGKPQQGVIRLSALHVGHEVLIQIIDDGAGLDVEAIRLNAIEKGLISRNEQLSEKDIFSLVFMPGFSTAKNVTDISGRGVGLDIVKKVVESLRGSLGIYSQKGIGTTITIKLPLTLLIIEGLLIKIGEENFVIPLNYVEECIELTKNVIALAHGRNIIKVRDEIVPYIRLREMFFISGNAPEIEQIVITRVEDNKVGFVVDSVIGEHRTVIKSLGSFYKDIKGISGATILGDGKVALILDCNELSKIADMNERKIIEKISRLNK